MKAETKVWLTLADEDYQNATLLWENHRYGATVFFSQQAVEKILKAYIIEFQNELPSKTHRVELLLKEAKLEYIYSEGLNVEELSKSYIRVRYPDLSKQYYQKRERVEPLFNMAKELYLWVKKKFNEH